VSRANSKQCPNLSSAARPNRKGRQQSGGDDAPRDYSAARWITALYDRGSYSRPVVVIDQRHNGRSITTFGWHGGRSERHTSPSTRSRCAIV